MGSAENVGSRNECLGDWKKRMPREPFDTFPLWASASETRGQLSANRYEYLKGVNRQEVVTSKPPELRPANLQLTWRAVASSLLISTCRTPYSVRFRTKMQTAGLSSWQEMGLLFFVFDRQVARTWINRPYTRWHSLERHCSRSVLRFSALVALQQMRSAYRRPWHE